MWLEAYVRNMEGLLGLLRRAISNLTDGALQNAKDDLYYCESLLIGVINDLKQELKKAEEREKERLV